MGSMFILCASVEERQMVYRAMSKKKKIDEAGSEMLPPTNKLFKMKEQVQLPKKDLFGEKR